MTKELPRKIAYINYWKSRNNFEDIEDKLEKEKADEMQVIKARLQQKGGHVGEFIEGQPWSSSLEGGGKVEQGTQATPEAKDQETQTQKRTRTIEVTIGDKDIDGKIFERNRTHTFGEFDALLALQKELAQRRMSDLVKEYETSYNKIPTGKAQLLEENIALIEAEKAKTDSRFSKLTDKITSIYSSEYSLMDIIFDSQFMVLYMLKLINYGFFALSLFLAEKLFSDMYMKNVYGAGGKPPDILIYIGITLALNLAFVVFMLVVLLLIRYIFKNPTNNFIVDMSLISKFLVDYAITTVILGLVGVICGSIIQKKRYFRYSTEGLRGVRALYELMLSLGALITVVPYFYII